VLHLLVRGNYLVLDPHVIEMELVLVIEFVHSSFFSLSVLWRICKESVK